MIKLNIVTLFSVLVLGTSAVFAQTSDIPADPKVELEVDAIIAEIEKAKNTLLVEKIVPQEAEVEAIIAEIEKAKNASLVETIVPQEVVENVKVKEVIAEKTLEQKPEPVTTATKKIIIDEALTEKVLDETTAPVVTTTKELVVKKAVIEKTPTPIKKAIPTKKTSQVQELKLIMPTVCDVPKPIVLSPTVVLTDKEGNILTKKLEDIYPKREPVVFSTNVAPERFRKKKKSAKKATILGNVENARVTAYLHSPLMSVDEASENLKSAGFEILSTYKVDKKGKIVSIVFTSEAIKKAAAKDNRGFAATLRLVVDTKNKIVNISNPIYVFKAFMQKEYNAKVAEDTLIQIHSSFSDLKASKEVVKFLALERYQFMENMPFYQDMKVIKKGKNEELLAKVKKNKKMIFEQHLSNGSILVGVQLGKRTSKFVKKIGYTNSGLLPYPILIENGEAKILAPQYYIAVMYPQLKMSKFMTIATVPGAITKDIDKIFR